MSTGEAVVFVADENGQAPPVEEAVSALIDEASRIGASDLFLASTEDGLEISVRHLGVVRRLRNITTDDGRRWLARIKILAGIPIDNRRRPNEGRWLHERADGHKLDIRVATIPTLHGEDFALRLLERNTTLQRLDGLGLDRQGLQSLTAMLHAPGGLILVTGPTVSGKTTTLYACLALSQRRHAQDQHDRGPDRVRRRGHPPVAGESGDRRRTFPSCCGACCGRRPT